MTCENVSKMKKMMEKNVRSSEKGILRLDPVRWERLMTAVLLALSVGFGWQPSDRTVWYVEMVWCVGLWAILFFTRRVFLFSTAAYFCFFVWMVLQVVGAHFTFEHVPMDWLTKPLGLVRNPYDRIAHFAVGWFAFPIAELFHRRGRTRSPGFAAPSRAVVATRGASSARLFSICMTWKGVLLTKGLAE